MAIPIISQLPEPPAPLDSDDEFNAKAYAFTTALTAMTVQINAALEWINSVYAQDVVAVAGTSLTLNNANAGQWNQFAATGAKAITISAASIESASEFAIWHIENASASGNASFNVSGVTLTPPAGGTNVIPPGGVASVKRTGAATLKLIGQVVAA